MTLSAHSTLVVSVIPSVAISLVSLARVNFFDCTSVKSSLFVSFSIILLSRSVWKISVQVPLSFFRNPLPVPVFHMHGAYCYMHLSLSCHICVFMSCRYTVHIVFAVTFCCMDDAKDL